MDFRCVWPCYVCDIILELQLQRSIAFIIRTAYAEFIELSGFVVMYHGNKKCRILSTYIDFMSEALEWISDERLYIIPELQLQHSIFACEFYMFSFFVNFFFVRKFCFFHFLIVIMFFFIVFYYCFLCMFFYYLFLDYLFFYDLVQFKKTI